MGEVLTTMKIMPDSPDVDLEAIKATIKDSMPEGAELHDIAEEPIAFGLVAIILRSSPTVPFLSLYLSPWTTIYSALQRVISVPLQERISLSQTKKSASLPF